MNKTAKAITLLMLSLCLVAGTFAQGTLMAKKPFFAGFAQDTLNQPWRNYQAVCVERELKKFPGVKVMVTDGLGRAEKQISDVEDMVARGVNILLISPAQEGALTPIVSQVYRSGIPVVLVDRGITSQDYTCFDTLHAVLPTRLSREEFYQHLASLYLKPNLDFVYEDVRQGRLTVEQVRHGHQILRHFGRWEAYGEGDPVLRRARPCTTEGLSRP